MERSFRYCNFVTGNLAINYLKHFKNEKFRKQSSNRNRRK